MNLSGKVTVVKGSGQGLGLAYAEALAAKAAIAEAWKSNLAGRQQPVGQKFPEPY